MKIKRKIFISILIFLSLQCNESEINKECAKDNTESCYVENNFIKNISLTNHDLTPTEILSVDKSKREELKNQNKFNNQLNDEFFENLNVQNDAVKAIIPLLIILSILAFLLHAITEDKTEKKFKILYNMSVNKIILIFLMLMMILTLTESNKSFNSVMRYTINAFENGVNSLNSYVYNVMLERIDDDKVKEFDDFSSGKTIKSEKEKNNNYYVVRFKDSLDLNMSVIKTILTDKRTKAYLTFNETSYVNESELSQKLNVLNFSDLNINETKFQNTKILDSISYKNYLTINFEKISLNNDKLTNKINFTDFINMIKNGSSLKNAYSSTIENDLNKIYDKDFISNRKEFVSYINYLAAEIAKRYVILNQIKENFNSNQEVVYNVSSSYCAFYPDRTSDLLKEFDTQSILSTQIALYSDCFFIENDKLDLLNVKNNKVFNALLDKELTLQKQNENAKLNNSLLNESNKNIDIAINNLIKDYNEINEKLLKEKEIKEKFRQQGITSFPKYLNYLQYEKPQNYGNRLISNIKINTIFTNNYVYIDDEKNVVDSTKEFEIVTKKFDQKFVYSQIKQAINSNTNSTYESFKNSQSSNELKNAYKNEKEFEKSIVDKLKNTSEIMYQSIFNIENTNNLSDINNALKETKEALNSINDEIFFAAAISNISNKLIHYQNKANKHKVSKSKYSSKINVLDNVTDKLSLVLITACLTVFFAVCAIDIILFFTQVSASEALVLIVVISFMYGMCKIIQMFYDNLFRLPTLNTKANYHFNAILSIVLKAAFSIIIGFAVAILSAIFVIVMLYMLPLIFNILLVINLSNSIFVMFITSIIMIILFFALLIFISANSIQIVFDYINETINKTNVFEADKFAQNALRTQELLEDVVIDKISHSVDTIKLANKTRNAIKDIPILDRTESENRDSLSKKFQEETEKLNNKDKKEDKGKEEKGKEKDKGYNSLDNLVKKISDQLNDTEKRQNQRSTFKKSSKDDEDEI